MSGSEDDDVQVHDNLDAMRSYLLHLRDIPKLTAALKAVYRPDLASALTSPANVVDMAKRLSEEANGLLQRAAIAASYKAPLAPYGSAAEAADKALYSLYRGKVGCPRAGMLGCLLRAP